MSELERILDGVLINHHYIDELGEIGEETLDRSPNLICDPRQRKGQNGSSNYIIIYYIFFTKIIFFKYIGVISNR